MSYFRPMAGDAYSGWDQRVPGRLPDGVIRDYPGLSGSIRHASAFRRSQNKEVGSCLSVSSLLPAPWCRLPMTGRWWACRS
ncbi:hypothetical protein CBM2637_B120130 [Cupriavidus taiwanensis]|nr:hypothetical protein CBM2637_B120130 [Cupriavidus taiwanensis]SPA56902.1 protein of unknown function [Cupriavidus taiwanensis]